MPEVSSLNISLGETILFGVLVVAMLAMSIYGLLIAKRAVHSAASMIIVMVGFAFLYTMLEAPFMGVVQVAVYTGAILMMFLFVLMMTGVAHTEESGETLRGQRPFAILGGLGTFLVIAGVVILAQTPTPRGMDDLHDKVAQSNPSAVAIGIFGSHLITMELAGSLLIVAAIGAMVLTHRESLRKRVTQEDLVDAKMAAYAESGRHIGQKPHTGVYAQSNSAANPSLDPEGNPIEESVPRMLRARGQGKSLDDISTDLSSRIQDIKKDENKSVGKSRMVGMPGEAAPVYPSQKELQSSSASEEETK